MVFISDSMAKQLSSANMLSGMSASRRTNARSNDSFQGTLEKYNRPCFDELYSSEELQAQQVKNRAITKLDHVGEHSQKIKDIISAIRVAPNTPESVRVAWVDAAEEVGWNGLGSSPDHGMHGKLFAQLQCNFSGGVDTMQDILGDSVDTAITVIEAARYSALHPSSGEYTANPSFVVKEVQFYDAFLERLNGIKDGSLSYEGRSIYDELPKNMSFEPDSNSTVITNESISSDSIAYVEGIDDAGTSYKLTAFYSGDSTPSAPVVNVVCDHNGQETTYKININDIKEEGASFIDEFALAAYVADFDNVAHRYPPGQPLGTSIPAQILDHYTSIHPDANVWWWNGSSKTGLMDLFYANINSSRKNQILDTISGSMDTIGKTAPDSVKRAWMETVQETGIDAFNGLSPDEKQGHYEGY